MLGFGRKFKMNKRLSLGFDIGGTFIKGGLVDSEGKIEKKFKAPTPRSPEKVVKLIKQGVLELSTNRDHPLGISCAGTVDTIEQKITGLGGNIQGWKNFDIGLACRKEGLSLKAIDNDANCALKAELVAGAGRGKENLLMVTIGTGIGGAFSIDGKTIYHGQNFAAMEIGHMILESNGRECICGQKGCAELYLSARVFKKEMILAGYSRADDFLAKEDNPFIKKYLESFADYIITLENIMNPSTILFGGGFVEYAETFLPRLRSFRDKRSNKASSTKLIKAEFDNEAGIIGAAFLAKEK